LKPEDYIAGNVVNTFFGDYIQCYDKVYFYISL